MREWTLETMSCPGPRTPSTKGFVAPSRGTVTAVHWSRAYAKEAQDAC